MATPGSPFSDMWAGVSAFFRGLLGRKEPLELSYTKISAYRFCPWKYKLIYEEGRRVPPNPHISLGLSIHRTLEAFHKNGHTELEPLLELYNEFWVNEGFQTPQQAMHFYEKGRAMLERYHAFARERKSEVVDVEKEFRLEIGGRLLRGIIDRIDRLPDGRYEVIDYKTHAEMWDQPRIDSDLQLTLYALGCRAALKIEPAVLSYFFLAHNRVAATQRTPEQEAAALSELERVARAIEAKEFAPDTNRCPRCDFKGSCRHSSARAPVPAARENAS